LPVHIFLCTKAPKAKAAQILQTENFAFGAGADGYINVGCYHIDSLFTIRHSFLIFNHMGWA
jgi:hypothetical protein